VRPFGARAFRDGLVAVDERQVEEIAQHYEGRQLPDELRIDVVVLEEVEHFADVSQLGEPDRAAVEPLEDPPEADEDRELAQGHERIGSLRELEHEAVGAARLAIWELGPPAGSPELDEVRAP
jgi:hypothetical protein